MFKVGDYVYDSNGDDATIVGITENPVGDIVYEVEYMASGSEGYPLYDILTEFDLTPASDVEIEHD